MLKKRDRKLFVYTLILWIIGLGLNSLELQREAILGSPFFDSLKETKENQEIQFSSLQNIVPKKTPQTPGIECPTKTPKKTPIVKRTKKQSKKIKTTTSGKRIAKINPNFASEKELISIKGIGPVLAKRIIEHRNMGKTFETGADLLKVRGLGKKKLNLILPSVKFK